MKIPILCCTAIVLFFASCNKSVDQFIEKQIFPEDKSDGFVLYTIKKGQHYATNNSYKAVELSELKFTVRFDSSAIYQSNTEVNQHDINKLYGFSDNNANHHQYSARFGWNWDKQGLHLYAYVYNEGKVSKTDLGTIAIGTDVKCSIKVSGNSYIFSANDLSVQEKRTSSAPLAKGYMLYPYFGGDETAPHNIHIRIKNL